MGQKFHPWGVGIIRDWDSKINTAEERFSQNSYEDLKSVIISVTVSEASVSTRRAVIVLMFQSTAKPGVSR